MRRLPDCNRPIRKKVGGGNTESLPLYLRSSMETGRDFRRILRSRWKKGKRGCGGRGSGKYPDLLKETQVREERNLTLTIMKFLH